MKVRVHWGMAVAVFYTVFALSTVGFVAFAMTRDVELVSDDYYARALAHDGHMRAVSNADALGARVAVSVSPGSVMLRVPAEMVPGIRGTATLYRASDARADRVVRLAPGADGVMQIGTAGLASGRWRLQVQWAADGREYYADRDLRLP
jgi:nitrogen fixation protein FixH